MRKFLCITALAFFCASSFAADVPTDLPARSGESVTSFDFTLAFDYYTSLRNPAYIRGSEVYQAFEFNANNATLYAGSQITSVNITTGTFKDTDINTVKNITIFLADDLDVEPFYTQSAKLGDEGGTLYKIDLNTPYTITEGKSVVIGYYFKLNSDEVNYISVDGVYHENDEGGWLGNRIANGDIVWTNISQTYGNLCIGCTITGENLPGDEVAVLSLSGTEFVEPGEVFDYIVYFQNTASNNVYSLEVEYSVGDGEKSTHDITLSEPMSYNQRLGLRFNDLCCKAPGIDIPVRFEITKVNGNDNISSDKSRIAFINCFDAADGFTRMHLIEEGTGTWCQWCPAGIVMMENIARDYADCFAQVAVHSGDAMQVASTSPVRNMFDGYPSAIVDRMTVMYPQNSNINTLLREFTDYYRLIPSLAVITTLEGIKSQDGSLKVNTGLTFALDIATADRYRLSYYITESGVGPYDQNNSQYSGSGIDMGGWESKPVTVNMLFDDVARRLEGGLTGLAGSIPASVEKGREYLYEATLPLGDVTKDVVNLIAFVIDNVDGTVVNVAQKTVDLTASVSDIEAGAGYKVIARDGIISVTGDFMSAKVFSISGVAVGELTPGSEVSLAKGLYLVVVDGHTHKVIVR